MLLDYIRAQPNLKGTKLGCGEGSCGACTVVLQVGDNTSEKRRIKHVAVNACLYPLIGIDGKHVITIEGIGTVDKPHPLQERLAKLHGSQCGFCTPGIVMSLYAVIRNAYNPETDNFDLTENVLEFAGHLDGNLCRCTGYKQILKAAKTFITQDLHRHLTKNHDGRTASDSLDGDHDELELAVLARDPVLIRDIGSTSSGSDACGGHIQAQKHGTIGFGDHVARVLARL